MLRQLGATSALFILLTAVEVDAININFGDVAVRNLGSYGFTAANSRLSFDSNATDQLYQMYGYLGNTTGTIDVTAANFGTASAIAQVAPDQAASSILLNATGAANLGVANGSIRIDYTFTLVDDTSAADLDGFLWDVSIVNLGLVDLDLVFYQYLDLDLNGTANNDIAGANTTRITVSDGTAPVVFAWYAANGAPADHFAVGPYPGLRNQLDGMGAAQDLGGMAGIFGPADFTGAFQYNISIPAGGSYTLAAGQVVVPEPTPALLTMLGLVGLAVSARFMGAGA
jgi:hypothetical protein